MTMLARRRGVKRRGASGRFGGRAAGAGGSRALDAAKRTGLLLLAAAVLAALLGGTLYGLGRWARCCSIFAITTIEVQGTERIDPEKIKEASGLSQGQNLFSFKEDEVRKKILDQEPWIRQVDISRRFPDKVLIHVKERRPAALVRVNGSVWIMDSQGRPFKVASKEDDFTGPIITGAEMNQENEPESTGRERAEPAGAAAPGRVRLDPQKVQDALTIVKLSRKGARALGFFNISQIDFPADDTVVIYTADKAVPFYLDRDRLKEQFYRAEKILYQLYTSGEYAKVASVTVGYGEDMSLAVLKKKRQ